MIYELGLSLSAIMLRKYLESCQNFKCYLHCGQCPALPARLCMRVDHIPVKMKKSQRILAGMGINLKLNFTAKINIMEMVKLFLKT